MENNTTSSNMSLKKQEIVRKYPDKIPLILNRSKDLENVPNWKNKYLIPKDLTLGQFTYVVRKRFQLKPEESLFLSINNKMYPVSYTFNMIYDSEKDKDGFLEAYICKENTFG